MTARYLLDTTVVSELRKPRPHGGVVAWLESLEGQNRLLESRIFQRIPILPESLAGIPD